MLQPKPSIKESTETGRPWDRTERSIRCSVHVRAKLGSGTAERCDAKGQAAPSSSEARQELVKLTTTTIVDGVRSGQELGKLC